MTATLTFDMLWDTLPLPAFILDSNLQIESVNPAAEQFAKTSAKHLINKPLNTCFTPNSIIHQTLHHRTQTIAQYGVELSTTERTAHICNIFANTLPPTRTLLCIQPLGEAQKFQNSLSHHNSARSVSAIAATLAHEIRNPLAGISGAAQLLAQNLSAEDKKLADMIQQEATRISHLVNRVEDFTANATPHHSVNIHDALERAVLAATAGFARHAKIIKEFDPSLPEAAGDAGQLLQVIQNLLKNAAEALPAKGGIIRVRTSYYSGIKLGSGAGGTDLPLQIDIIDNGHGIAPDFIEHIFAPFVSSKKNGTGLGLALVSQIIANHGGLIDCDSRDGRTCFTLRLPVFARVGGE